MNNRFPIIRANRNQVLESVACHGKGTMGWSFGFKLNMNISHLVVIVALKLTKGNEDARRPQEYEEEFPLFVGSSKKTGTDVHYETTPRTQQSISRWTFVASLEPSSFLFPRSQAIADIIRKENTTS